MEVKKARTIPEDSIAERVLKLFTVSSVPTEKELEMETFNIAQDFLRMDQVFSKIPFNSLVGEFKDTRIPSASSDMDRYMNYLAEKVVPHSTHIASPRCLANMTTALPYFVRALAPLITAMNQNLVKMDTSKVLTPIERQALGMMHRLIYRFSSDFYEEHVQNNESTLGIIVSGGTLANITALWCARNSALGAETNFVGTEEEGLPSALKFYDQEGAVVIGSSLMHYSFKKATDLLGLGKRGLIYVPTDSDHRIDLIRLRETIANCRANKRRIIAIVGIAGATDTGSVDPLSDIAEIAHKAKIHFHVDAAWGGPLLFSETQKHKLAGIEQANSVTVDGHKQLYLPTGLGLVLLRDPHLAKVIEKRARYIVRLESDDLGKRSPEGSRPGNVLFLHAALNIIGRDGYEFLVDQGIRNTQYMADAIRARPEFELLIEPPTNILLYRYIPEPFRKGLARGKISGLENQHINHFNEQLQKAQSQKGQSYVSRTKLEIPRYGKGHSLVALRAVLSNPLTTHDDINAVLDEQVAIAAELAKSHHFNFESRKSEEAQIYGS